MALRLITWLPFETAARIIQPLAREAKVLETGQRSSKPLPKITAPSALAVAQQKLKQVQRRTEQFLTRKGIAVPGVEGMYSFQNQLGTDVYLSDRPINYLDVSSTIRHASLKGDVTVLTGTHGSEVGEILASMRERQFFYEDLRQLDPALGVKVVDVTGMSKADILQAVAESKTPVVCGWCYGASTTGISDALGAPVASGRGLNSSRSATAPTSKN